MQKYADVVLDRKGNVVPGASVLVKTLAGATATIYGSNGGAPIGNPITTDNLGRFSFYAADGRYTLETYIGSLLLSTQADIQLEDPADDKAAIVAAQAKADAALPAASLSIQVGEPLIASPSWDNVPLLDASPGSMGGGPGGALNLPAQALLNRTEWLAAAIHGLVSVWQYFVAGESDAGPMIQRAIDANPGKRITLGDGYYSTAQTIVIQTDGTQLVGSGVGCCSILHTGAAGDGVHFKCASAATPYTYLNNCGIDGIKIQRLTTGASGVGLRLTQCNAFEGGAVQALNFPDGAYLQEGGQSVHFNSFNGYLSTLYPSALPNCNMMRFTGAPIDGGDWQYAYTSHFDRINLGGSYLAEVGLKFEMCDGITFGGGYVAAPKQASVRIKPSVSGKHVSVVHLGTIYFDGVNQSNGTINAIEIIDDGFDGASIVNNIDISGCTIGNYQGKGLYSTHKNIQTFIVDPSRFINFVGTEIDVAGGDQSGFVGLPVAFTPTLTFASPGNLAVNYTTRIGRSTRNKDGTVTVAGVVQAVVTTGTASGELQISGLIVPSGANLGANIGAMMFNGVNKAGYTQFAPRIFGGASSMHFTASGSGVGASTISAADVPSGSTVILQFEITYESGELG